MSSLVNANKSVNQAFNQALGSSSVILEINNVPYQNFLSVTVNTSMQNFARSFQVALTMDVFKNFPIKLGDTISIVIDKEAVFTGFIESMDAGYDNDRHDISISGRDKLGDVLDGSIIEPVTFNTPISLKDIILKILNSNGIQSIELSKENAALSKGPGFLGDNGFIGVIDNAIPELFNKGDFISSKQGENIFEIINSLAIRRQVLVTSDGFGNLIIERGAVDPSGEDKYNTPLVHRHKKTSTNPLTQSLSQIADLNQRQNNILSANIAFDNSERYNKYIFQSQQNALSALSSEINPSSLVNQQGQAIDNQIRSTRTLVVSADTSRNSATAKDRATWEANIRRVRGRKYECKVQGFKPDLDKILWQPNKLVQVLDERLDIDGEMLINSVQYSYGEGGSIVNLSLSDPDSFSIQANISKAEERTNKTGLEI